MALCCDEPFDGEARSSEQWSYVGKGKGAYETVSDVVFVGHGKGSIDKERVVVASGTNWRPACAVACGMVFLLVIGILIIFGFHRPVAAAADEIQVFTTEAPSPKQIIIKHHYITQNRNKVVGVPVPGPAHLVYHKVYAPHKHFECYTNSMNYRAWTQEHQSWCCWRSGVACPTKVVTKDKYVPITKTVGVKVPKYHYVHVAGPTPRPKIVHVKVPAPKLPPRIVQDPFPVAAERPPPHIHYKYVPVPEEVKIPKVVYDKKVVKVPVPVKKYVPKIVHKAPEVIYKTHTIYDHPQQYDCVEGFHAFKTMWTKEQREYCCWKEQRGCATDHEVEHENVITKTKYIDVPVPSPPKVVIRHHQIVKTTHHSERHFNCEHGYSNWYFGWSKTKQGWCCAHESRGCPGSWHGSMHLEGHVHVEHGSIGGHATGRIYDCEAGYSNWLQGWSDSKKTWCCDHHHKGCVAYKCFHKHPSMWSAKKSDWCCKNFQRGCPQTTISPLGCQAACTYHGKTSLCIDRIHWAMENHFSGRDNACALSYSQVQVECDICRGCSIEAAGCEVHVATSEPYDCNAALNNFFRAWSPPKKQWCCSSKGKGCEGPQPPAVDPGYGMVWKHVQVNGYWTWIAVSSGAGGGGGGHYSKPYDCHVGLANWQAGWSMPKKSWCCAHEHTGCGGGGGGGGGGHWHSHTTHTVIHVYHGGGAMGGGAAGGAGGAGGAAGGGVIGGGAGGAAGGGLPPGAAGHGMMWEWKSDGGNWHWAQEHMNGAPKYNCRAGLSKFKIGWSGDKKEWCCHFRGLGCP